MATPSPARLLFAGLTAAALLLGAHADTVADELQVWGKAPVKGTVISEEGGIVKFKTESGEILEVKRSMIQKLTTDAEAAENSKPPSDTDPDPEPETPAGTKAPALPTKRKPAGGWMMLLEKQGKVMGFRAVELKPQGTGFVMEEQQFELDPAGSPKFMVLSTTTFGPEMQCLGTASRVIAKGRGRKDQDDTQRIRMGGGKVELELQNRGAAAKAGTRYAVPPRTIFRGSDLALLLHGKLAQDIVEGKELQTYHLPVEYSLQHGPKDPEGKALPLTIALEFEIVGVGEPDAKTGIRKVALKAREVQPAGSPFAPMVTRYELAVKNGEPVKLLTVEQAGAKGMGGMSLPRQTHAPMRTVKGHAIHDMIPPRWRNLEFPQAPDAILPSKD